MKSQKPNFTIFIPTYNSERYIKECIESALAQTYSSFKIVVLDSGSNDGTYSILEAYSQMERVKIVKTENRLGIVENWDRIKTIVETDWFTILGHDDVLHPDFLNRMSESIFAYPQSKLFTSHFTIIGSVGEPIRKCFPIPLLQKAKEYVQSRFIGERDSFATGYVIHTETYQTIGGIPHFPDLLFADDALWVLLSLNSPIICVNESLFQYRFHQNSTSGTPNQTHLVDAAISYLTLLHHLAKEDPLLLKILHEAAPAQMIPLAKGFLGLTLLKNSFYGTVIGSHEIEKVTILCQLISTKSETVLKSLPIRVLLLLNRYAIRKIASIFFFLLLPSYKRKAGIY